MSNYQREELERVLGVLWDSIGLYGIPNPTAPDEGMPKAASDPSHRNSHLAILADVRKAWDHSHMTNQEQQVLLLRYAFDMTTADIALIVGRDKSNVSRAEDRGLRKMLSFLNGEAFYEYEEDLIPSV